MFNLASIIEIGSTAFAKAVYSILVGTIGIVIVVAFLNTIVPAEASIKLLPLILAFNTAMSGYMVLEKTGAPFRHKWSVAVATGITTTLLATIALNLFFLQTVGLTMIGLAQLPVLLFIGIGSSWFGAVLAINYLNLK